MDICERKKRRRTVRKSSYYAAWGVSVQEFISWTKLTQATGQGKTQLALEYTRKQRASHSVFWVDATSSGTAFRSFENIGAKVAPGATFPNPEAARTYLLRALEALNDPLLFVFDTFDQPGEFTTVRDFFPYGAKIILTSRHNDSKRLGSSIEVGAMPDDEGVELLLHQAGLQHTTENIDSAIAITKELRGLALAIDQAATYISARHVPLHAFPGVYEKRRAAIFKHVSQLTCRFLPIFKRFKQC